MSYKTSFYGRINISPPLPYDKFKDSPHHPDRYQEGQGLALSFVTTETEQDTPLGKLTVIEAVAVIVAWQEPIRAYNIVQELHEIVTGPGAGHEFTGEMLCEGPEFGDYWKLAVVGGIAQRVLPQIHWPDGTIDHSRYADRDDNYPKGVVPPADGHHRRAALRALR